MDLKINVDSQRIGHRLDIFISQKSENISRNYAQKLIENGRVAVNGEKICLKKYQLKEYDVVDIDLPEPDSFQLVPEDIEIDIVFEDAHLAVINKAKGLVVHPGQANERGTLVNGLINRFGKNLSNINNDPCRPGIVHRLDKDSSGLLVIAKSNEAYLGLTQQLIDRKVKKIYQAIVYDNFKEDRGIVDLKIGRSTKNRIKRAVMDTGKDAVTEYRVIERFGNFTHLELQIYTGRTHQIRVHMAHIKHPLLGDNLYGPKKKGLKGHFLHSSELAFIHPITLSYMDFKAEPPPDFKEMLKTLKD